MKTRHPWFRATLSATLAFFLALLVARPALAHANLVRSVPAAGATLDASPPSIEMEFTEDLDPSFSRIQLFDSRNQLIEKGPGEVTPANTKIMRLIIPDLEKGSYTAIWRVRSSADGHITQGSLPFGVGVAASAGSLIPAPGTPDPATLTPAPADALARWLNYLAAMLALGAAPFAVLVWRPAFRRWQENDDARLAADAAMTGVLRRLLFAGSIAFLLTNLFFLLTQAATAAEVPLLAAIGAPLVQLLRGSTGLLWLARLALILQLVVLTWRLPLAGSGPARLWWVSLVIGGVVLLTFSLLSHAAASTQALVAVPLDWLHLAAMVAWLGGLPGLLAAVLAARRAPERALPLSLLVPRFTRVALPSVVALTLTGVYQYSLHIQQPDLLAATTYGRALLVKVAVFAVLVALGALNMLILTRRLRGGNQTPARAFGRTVRVELIVGALVLLLAAVMTGVAPSLAAWEAHEQQGIAQTATQGDVDLTLRIAPAQIGDNEFAVDVTDRRPGADAAQTKVLMHFDMQGMEMEGVQTEAKASTGQRYLARGNFTTMGGRWHIGVTLRRAGFDDVQHTFEVDILRGAPFVITE